VGADAHIRERAVRRRILVVTVATIVLALMGVDQPYYLFAGLPFA
jgi:hypothetical protein